MQQTYQDVLNAVKTVIEAHPKVYSVDDGRELEFDTKKKIEWPRVFIRTDASPITAGQGSAQVWLNFTLLCTDKVKADRSDIVEVMSKCHEIMVAILATLNQQQLIYLEANYRLDPLYDYHDTQTSGWEVPIQVQLTGQIECYTVPDS